MFRISQENLPTNLPTDLDQLGKNTLHWLQHLNIIGYLYAIHEELFCTKYSIITSGIRN